MSQAVNDPVQTIINSDDPGLLIRQADQIGKQAAETQLTTNQIRNVYGPVRQIELAWPEITDKSSPDDRQRASAAYRQVVLLKPKLGYLAARDKKLKQLETVFDTAIDEIGKAANEHERRVRFKRFVEFFEAILAYHKKYEEERKSGNRTGGYHGH